MLQVALGPANKTKRYSMKSGTREKYADNLKEMFRSEKQAIDKFMKLLIVSATNVFLSLAKARASSCSSLMNSLRIE